MEVVVLVNGIRTTLSLSPDTTLKTLKKLILERDLVKGKSFHFSLNESELLTDETRNLCDLSIVSGDTVYILFDEPSLTLQSQNTNSELQSSNSELKGTPVSSTSNFGSYVTRQKSSEQNVGRENEVDLLCNALHMMMLDSGFVSKNLKNSSCTQVSRYNYTAPFGPMVPVEMVCTKLGPQLITHGSCLHLQDCITSSFREACIDLPGIKTANIASCVLPINTYSKTTEGLCNTSQLSQHFKDKVTHTLLTNLRRALDLPESGTILCLSHEVKLQIMSMLDLKSLLNLSEVNREFHMLVQDSVLWKKLFMKTFGAGMLELPNGDEESSWKKIYLTNYHKQREIRQVPPELPFPVPPLMMGGDYDPFERYHPFPFSPHHKGVYRQKLGSNYRFIPYNRDPVMRGPLEYRRDIEVYPVGYMDDFY